MALPVANIENRHIEEGKIDFTGDDVIELCRAAGYKIPQEARVYFDTSQHNPTYITVKWKVESLEDTVLPTKETDNG